VFNRRKAVTRIAIALNLLFKPSGKDVEYFTGVTSDVSLTGMGIETSNMVEMSPGEPLEIKASLTEKKKTFYCKGEVAWMKRLRNKYKVGVKIMEMEEEFQDEILGYADRAWQDVRKTRFQ
jgi:c-di-GMP-binding flagellar brake protein YcgR